MVIDIAGGAALGIVLGAATGIPLGVVNLSVIEAAARAGRRPATAIGIGGAIADTIHAGLAFVGVAPLLDEHPDALKILAAISAAIVIAYAIVVARGRPNAKARPGGVLMGLALTLPNPAPLAAWIAVAGALLPGASIAVGIAAAIGVGVGSAAWFALLARLAERGRSSAFGTRWLPIAVSLVFVAIAIVALVRAWR
jgi:threonine/homoserine/homoserine lactone efflux protein